MKTFLITLLGIIVTFSTFSAVAQEPAYSATDEELARACVVNKEDKTVTFIFCQRMWKDSGSYCTVKGSFNGWLPAQYILLPDNQGNYSLTLPLASVMVPGNSGRPEYQIMADGMTLHPSRSSVGVPDGYVFADGSEHFMIILDEEDLEKAKIDNQRVSTLKTLEDFDLTTREGQEEISNFRKVPGTKQLFRSFHPIKYSYKNYETEYTRHCVLEQLCIQEGIASDINLSGSASLRPENITLCGQPFTESVPDFYKEIMTAGRVLNVGLAHGLNPPTSEDVYFQHWFNNGQINVAMSRVRISQMLQEIVEFVNSDKSQAPYLIHCHVGQDRTGVMCALISGLCGCSWEEIAQDFEKTQRLGCREMRERRLLKFALEKFLDIDPYAAPSIAMRAGDADVDDDEQTDPQEPESSIYGNGIENVDDIGALIRQKMIDGGYLSAADFDAFDAKINPEVIASTESVSIDSWHQNAQIRYYDMAGRMVATPSAPGLYIRVDSTGKATKMVIK